MTLPSAPARSALESVRLSAQVPSRPSFAAELLRRHWLLLSLLALGAALRVVVQLAYQPAILYTDSYTYLWHAYDLDPRGLRPVGYEALLLRWALSFGDLALVPLIQHLLGLGMGVVIYAVLTHRGVRTWLAALAAAPVLLDGYQLQIEENVMSDTLFQALVVCGLAVLLWRRWPGPAAAATGGLLLGLSATVRFVGLPLLVVAFAYLLVLQKSWRLRVIESGVLCLGFLVPLLVYGAWYHQMTGEFGLSSGSIQAKAVYGRTAAIADCGQLARADAVPRYIVELCPADPRYNAWTPDHFAHHAQSPAKSVDLPPGVERTAAMHRFAVQVATQQPLGLTAAVGKDFARGFAPVREMVEPDVPLERWRFQDHYPEWPGRDAAATVASYGGDRPEVVRPLGAFLRDYQSVVYTPGLLFAAGLLAPMAAAIGLGRARGSTLRAAGLLVAVPGATLLLVSAIYEFSWRYQLPSIVLLPFAAALGITALIEGRPKPRSIPELADDPVDTLALQDFHARYRDLRFGPAVIVIAAYNEAESIGGVLAAIPAQACGVSVDTLVVDDGSSDGTGEVAVAHGAYTCIPALNRGQGAALRLGYRIARERGARYIVTTDADGQYDTDELPVILQPLIDDEADFVTGSRRLGREETNDWIRHIGVRVFAWLVSLLTLQRITDTSNGFRAMKAGVTGVVTLTQPQYQASELLLGVLAHGFRVAERPTTMRLRAAGTSKKGGNLLYGLRYGRVVFGTWARERSRRGLIRMPRDLAGAPAALGGRPPPR